jgi:hypothetical protein
MGAGMVGTLMLIYAGFTALAVAAAVSVVRKAGYSGWWAAAGLIPLVNVVMLFAFAFAEWPVERDLRRARAIPTGPQQHPSFVNPAPASYASPAAHPIAPAPSQPYAPPAPPPFATPAPNNRFGIT